MAGEYDDDDDDDDEYEQDLIKKSANRTMINDDFKSSRVESSGASQANIFYIYIEIFWLWPAIRCFQKSERYDLIFALDDDR